MKPTAGNLTVMTLPAKEKTKREIAFERSTDYLTEAMDELLLVEKKTGRTGLSKRVCMAFCDVLLDAMRMAEARRG